MKNRIDGLRMELGFQAGLDARQDAIKVGSIQAMLDILDIDHEEASND